MRLPPPRLPPIPTSTIDAATTSSSLFNGRAQYTWRRSYSDRPFITGDSHHTDHGDSRAPQTPPQPNFHPRPPPTFARSPDALGAAFVNYRFPAWAPPQQQFAPRPHPGFHPAPSHYGQPLPQFRYPPNFRSPPPHFRPTPNFRPTPPHRPPDYREWKFALTQSLPQSERFTVVSYNILADYLAREHRPQLYFHIPHHVLEWEWRKRRLMIEFGLWNPDILCLQEVDKFHDIEEELTARGYTGIWKMRTGNAVDGCAIFWRTNRFHLQHEENIEFSKLGLRDNVAQICVLESSIENPVESVSSPLPSSFDQPKRANQIVICNIHVLYNPKRGEIKLGQVRVLLDRAYAVSGNWNDAPVILCGDFNSTPKSPLYNFIAERKLNLSGLARDQVSGQYSASIYTPRPYFGPGLYRAQPKVDKPNEVANGTEQDSCFPGSPINSKPQNDMENASPTLEVSLPQCSTGVLHIDAQSSVNDSGSADKVHLSSPSGSHELPQASIDDSAVPKNTASFSMEDKLVDLCVNEVDKIKVEDLAVPKNTSFSMEDELVDLCVNEVEKIKIEDSAVPKNTTSFSMEDELVDLCVNEVERIKIEDSSCDIDDGNTSLLRDTQQCVGGNVSLHDLSQYSNSIESNSVSAGVESNQLDNSITVGQGGSDTTDVCRLEESSDPNFFKELLGTEDSCGYREEADPSSAQIRKDFSSLAGLHAAVQGNNSYTPYNPYLWTPMEIEVASGSAECNFVEHSLKLRSAYTDVEDYAGTKDLSREPQVTSYNRQFMGTVDYIWYSEGLQTVKVLDTIPKHVLKRTPGFPTPKWGSDHIALACQFSFMKRERNK